MDMVNSEGSHDCISHVGVIILTFPFYSFFSTQKITLISRKAYVNFPTHVCCNAFVAWLPGSGFQAVLERSLYDIWEAKRSILGVPIFWQTL